MRRLFLLITLLCALFSCAVVSAAQVTDAKWGVDKNNVLRLVVDVDDTAGYAVNLENGSLNLIVNAPVAPKEIGVTRIKSSIADSMQVTSQGSSTVVRLPLKKSLTEKDYKAFVLKKDPVTKRPFRVVLDITADKQLNANVAPATKVTTPAANNNNTASTAPVISNKPVVSNRPVKNTTIAKAEGASVTNKQRIDGIVIKPVVKEDKNKSESKKDEERDDKKNPVKPVVKVDSKDKNDLKAVKSKNKFKTSGGIKGKVITLDPGHGGSDPGAIGKSGLKEKQVTLAIAEYVQEMLEKKDAKVHMTRTKDVDVYGPNASDKNELQARVNVAEKYDSDLFISIHINSSVNKKVGGFSTYYYPKTGHDLRLAKHIQNKLASNFGVDNLGVREANFYVTKRSSMPAVLLELCFISNEKEEKLMQGKWFKKKAARMIVEGIEEYFE